MLEGISRNAVCGRQWNDSKQLYINKGYTISKALKPNTRSISSEFYESADTHSAAMNLLKIAIIFYIMSKKSCGILIEFSIVHKIGYNNPI